MQAYAAVANAVLLVGIALITLVVLVGLNIPWRWKLRRYSGPTPTLFLGNLADFVRLLPTRAHAEWFERYGSVYVMYMGSLPYVVVRDADMVHEIMVKQYKHFPARSPLFAPLDRTARRVYLNGMLFNRGALWSTIRSSTQPLFHSASLQKFAPQMRKSIDRMVAMLSRHVSKRDVTSNMCGDAKQGSVNIVYKNGTAGVVRRKVAASKLADSKPIDGNASANGVQQCSNGMRGDGDGADVDVHPMFSDYAFEALGPLAYGIACDSTAASGHRLHASFVQAAKLLFDTPVVPSIFAAAAMALPPAAVPLLAWLSKRFATRATKEREAGRVMISGAVYGLMNAARKRHNLPAYTPHPEFIPSSAVIESGMVPEEGTLLDLLVQAQHKDSKQPLSDMQIVPQANAFLLAGHEASAATLALAVFFLAQHPAVERKLRQELQQHAGLELDSPEACEQLAYTQACIKETLRMMPPIPITQRVAACDTAVADWPFPANVGVTIDVAGLHHDERYWTNPTRFMPERFVNDQEPKHPMAYIPFGAGPRNCIGRRFAVQEMTIALARLYSRFTFKLSHRYEHEPLEMRYNISCVPRNGLWVTVHPAPTVA